MDLLYDNFVQKIANRFDTALSEIEAVHNFEFGSEFEVAICKTLRRALPQRFGICRGFAVDRNGKTAGDDIIIYERHRFPTLRALDADDYAQKEKVPIEAILAYIEAKHTLEIEGDGQSSLKHALEQSAAVKNLCDSRKPVPLAQILPSVRVAGAKIEPLFGYPEIRNPMYTMILSRRVRIRPGEGICESHHDIEKALLTSSSHPAGRLDLLVAGRSHVACARFLGGSEPTLASPFNHGRSQLVGRPVNGLAFGVAVVHLLWALDFIDLGKMPWAEILADGMGYENLSWVSP